MIRGDVKGCRDSARACVDLANNVTSTQLQSTLYDLAQSWMKLAAQLEQRESHNTAPTGASGQDRV
jgi:hypothetical protein